MAKSKLHTVPHRRKDQGKTDYRTRLDLLKSRKKRLIVRVSLKSMVAQIADYDAKGDKIVLTVHSRQLKKLGWDFACNNTPGAYLTGYLLGRKALDKGVKEAVLDIGLQQSVKGSRIYAVLKGALDAGVKIPHSEEVLPTEDRIRGKHIVDYEKSLEDKAEKQFSKPVSAISDRFDEIKKKIDGQK